MFLFAHLMIHFLFAVLVGFFVWKIWKRPLVAFVFAILGGFFIDLDHFIDYFFVFGWNFDWQAFFSGQQFRQSGKVYVFFHAWEYVLLGGLWLIIFKKKISEILKSACLALILGIFLHLVADVFLNQMPVAEYSIIYRIRHSFIAPFH